ncbi:MAG: GMC oxidoreductase [Psychrobacillus psychrodurans]
MTQSQSLFTLVEDPHSSMMGDSPDNFAINNDMLMSDVENLIVCGASAFPHFDPTNPTPYKCRYVSLSSS